jgi:DNA-binding NarL/FixJ family response regulator
VNNGDHPVRVLVVDDHTGYRSSVVKALSLVPNVEVAGEAASGEQACEIVLALEPDVVIIDSSMPGMDGIGTLRRLRKIQPHTQFVMMTSFDSPSVEQLAIAEGASQVVTKGSPLEEIVGVILHAADDHNGHSGFAAL